LKYANEYKDKGKLLLGGAFNPPAGGAAIVFRNVEKEEVEKFAKADPYVINKVVTNWKINEWTVVVDGTQKKSE